MDHIAHLIHTVLASTQPANTADGKPSPAKYTLDAKVRDQVTQEAADLMAGYPLYPTIRLE
jgi:glycine hydroxymethyltransferase